MGKLKEKFYVNYDDNNIIHEIFEIATNQNNDVFIHSDLPNLKKNTFLEPSTS